ncbi:MAG: DUF452 family protein [Desulfotalea sp.]
MKYFLHKSERKTDKSLLIFFNGWGMDENPILPFVPVNRDLLIIYDYRKFDFSELSLFLDDYDNCEIISWSMGVLAGQEALSLPALSTKCKFALAINTTLQPINDEFGIPLNIYKDMTNNFLSSLEKFQKGMCLRDLGFFLKHKSLRSSKDQLEELEILYKKKISYIEKDSLFNAVLIGRGDKIIPAKNQLKFWQKTPKIIRSLAHYPFANWPNLDICLKECKNEVLGVGCNEQ